MLFQPFCILLKNTRFFSKNKCFCCKLTLVTLQIVISFQWHPLQGCLLLHWHVLYLATISFPVPQQFSCPHQPVCYIFLLFLLSPLEVFSRKEIEPVIIMPCSFTPSEWWLKRAGKMGVPPVACLLHCRMPLDLYDVELV